MAAVEVKYKQLFINNEFVDAESGKTFETVYAGTGKPICQVAEADAADVDKAAKAAHAALAKWRQVTPGARARLMFKLADLVEAHAEALAALETLDSGKPLHESRSIDVPIFHECIRYYAGWTDKIYGQTIPSNGQYMTYTLHEPVGVVGAIIPWNFPLGMLAWKMGPALACGNTLVVKPAEQTPLTALYIAQLTKEAGFPPGVFNVVPGFGPTAGAAMCRHPLINKIAFTGSGETGRIVQRACTEVNLKRCTLELGGKSANIVFDDVDRDQLEGIVASCHEALFYNMGQVCCAGSRLFVQSGIYDEFVKLSVEFAKNRTVGDPFGKDVQQGPQVDKVQFEKVLSYIELGQKEGAKMECGGGPAASEGYYVQPTIFSDVKDDMRVAQEEIFGPVLCILKFDTADEVIARANATPYGLAAAVWTSNIKTAQMMQRGLQAGTVWINMYGVVDHVAPFGGFKDSGHGRDLGAYALQHYTEVKTVCSAL